jgi:transposase
METKKSQQRFTEEFKTEAVRQVTERGHPVAEVAARPRVMSKKNFSPLIAALSETGETLHLLRLTYREHRANSRCGLDHHVLRLVRISRNVTGDFAAS